jgi:hypothetical protein
VKEGGNVQDKEERRGGATELQKTYEIEKREVEKREGAIFIFFLPRSFPIRKGKSQEFEGEKKRGRERGREGEGSI